MNERTGKVGTGEDIAVRETIRLYHAWLGYLLRRLGEGEVRVPAGELRQALGRMTCRVGRAGGDYVISFTDSADATAAGKETSDDSHSYDRHSYDSHSYDGRSNDR